MIVVVRVPFCSWPQINSAKYSPECDTGGWHLSKLNSQKLRDSRLTTNKGIGTPVNNQLRNQNENSL